MTDAERVLPCYVKTVCAEYYVSKLEEILKEDPQPPEWFISLAKSSNVKDRQWEWCFSHKLNKKMEKLRDVNHTFSFSVKFFDFKNVQCPLLKDLETLMSDMRKAMKNLEKGHKMEKICRILGNCLNFFRMIF